MSKIPEVKIAILGGSISIGAGFPREYKDVKVIKNGMLLDTLLDLRHHLPRQKWMENISYT